ncbi:hypothetical protein HS088_TW15G01184 [Tripterygium wilfordii]|uniref:Peptidase A1 domain-containing protein n=1 Tax=Tripterygium wilfordii TaxID=458696 RepID=A0A7J7CNK5_TRIWF|nr:aspartic proteinase NANA, chloroplast-like [Tripterygium wilfordii]KAF5735670.1 hypothetical protein HS088_TW15G01184 [Tripterygium wilfordii]
MDASWSLLWLFILLFSVKFLPGTTAPVEVMIHKDSPQISGTSSDSPDRIKQLVESDYARQKMRQNRLSKGRMAIEFDRSIGEDLLSKFHSHAAIPMRSAADAGLGQYFVSFRVGTPPKKFVLIADTASDVTWMNCHYGCIGSVCPDNRPKFGRIFQARQSPSFKPIPCSSDTCKIDLARSFSVKECPKPDSPCVYDYSYADGSMTLGFFGTETVTVGLDNRHKVRLHDVLIGCSESKNGTFHNVDGVMGLGYNKHSFAVKVAAQFGNKFSYCLVDHLSRSNISNFLSFGRPKEGPYEKMKYTELLLGVVDPYYALKVRGISIDGEMLNIAPEVWEVGVDSGTIIDSGTSLTMLTDPAYDAVMAAFEAGLADVERTKLVDGPPLEFCFNSGSYTKKMIPKLAFHFVDGVEFKPPAKSYVFELAKGVACLGFLPTPGHSVIGNIMQQNHLWEFDLGKKRLGFLRSDCKYKYFMESQSLEFSRG